MGKRKKPWKYHPDNLENNRTKFQKRRKDLKQAQTRGETIRENTNKEVQELNKQNTL